ncbi:MAG: hypothetical protein ACE5GE_04000, partial [Phycisphaerae bacterium]
WGILPDQVVPLDAPQRQEIQRRRALADPYDPDGGSEKPEISQSPTSIWVDPQLQAALDALSQSLK